MLNRLLEFTHALRDAGIPVSVGENLDALRALSHIPMEDREVTRGALAAAMIKSETHRSAFDTLFDLYFGPTPDVAENSELVPEEAAILDDEAFMAELFDALRSGGGGGNLRELARRAVHRYGRVEDSPSGSVYFEYPVFRAINLAALVARADREDDGSGLAGAEHRIRRAEMDAAVAIFRRGVQDEVRRQVVARKGPEAVARHAVRPLLENLDLATATAAEIAELRKAIRPLARKLATRLALKHKRASAGRLDIRKTVRHSLSTGGVPFDLHLKHRAPHRPELFVLCDVSSSVARYARFSLMLVHALSSQFSRVRSFMFIDTIDEVTRFFEHEDFLAAIDHANEAAQVVRFDDHSDYGASLTRFMELYGGDVGPKSTVLILGDARTNNRIPHAEVLKELKRRARSIWWLNPEAVGYWDTGDSAALHYEHAVNGMVEVRNLKQLEEFIARVL